MKNLFLLITSFLVINTSSAQRLFSFNIQDKYYTLEERELDDMFSKVFTTLIEKGTTKEKYFDIWATTYANWKDNVHSGVELYEIIGDRITRISHSADLSNEMRGFKADGKAAKGDPNKPDNVGRRVSIMNFYLPKLVIYKFTGKEIVN